MAPRTSIPLARLPQCQHQEQDPIPTSLAHFPGIQAPHPEPATTLPWGEGNTNIDGSSSDEDDFDSGFNTHVWNRTVSLTYLPAITLLASLLFVSVASEHAHGPVASCDMARRSQPPCITPVQKQHLIAITAMFDYSSRHQVTTAMTWTG
ncbi:hypothetical protein EDB85DRAFT_1887172 [Lactarius pseudohatsudake]|nr:hypothetical protein EDB85DRAFT_1887172 [Lactarius pseudohatsudake]